MNRLWNASGRRPRTQPAGRRRRRLGAGAVLGAAAIVFWHASRPPRYPDQLPVGTSDVSAQQTLSDHHLALPTSVRDWRYSAQRSDQNYPLAAEFTFPCAELQPFTNANALVSVALWYQLADIGVYDLALNLGWCEGMPGARWYQRLDGDQNAALLVQPSPGGQQCTDYLLARREDDGREHSPLGGDIAWPSQRTAQPFESLPQKAATAAREVRLR